MILILSPYGRNEVTAAAIRLADLAVQFGLPVRLVALGVHEHGIHPYWDQRVFGYRKKGIYYASRGAEHCVWFQPSPIHHEMVKLVAPTAKHVWVPSLHGLKPQDANTLAMFSTVVAPTKLTCQLIKKHLLEGNAAATDGLKVTWSRFDSGLQYTNHEGFAGNGGVRLAMHCDRASIDECGLATLRIVQGLLDQVERSEVTLICTKTWGKRDRHRLRELVDLWEGRLAVVYQRSFVEQARIFQTHDWCILPGTWADFGITAARANSCGLPVLSYDLSPWSELVTDNHNGILIECEVGCSWIQAPVAAASATIFLDKALEVLADPERLLRMQNRDWGTVLDNKGFASFWRGHWGLG